MILNDYIDEMWILDDEDVLILVLVDDTQSLFNIQLITNIKLKS